MTEKELEKIYNEGYRAVYWTAMALLRNEADAEDVVQDTFVSFIESYGYIEDTSKVVALLKKIAANKCLNRLKSSRTEYVEDEVLETMETVPEDFLPDSIVESAEMRRIVMNIIENSLSEDVRRTIILFYFNEMSTKEISEALGVPQGTVLWRLSYARKQIKKEVEKYEEESNTKLFAMPLPFLTKLFNKEAEQVLIKPMPASLLHLSASAEAVSTEAGKRLASEAIKKGTGSMVKKIIIGSTAVITAGVITGVILFTTNQKSNMKAETERNDNTEITSVEASAKNSDSAVVTDESTTEISETTSEPTTGDDTKTKIYSKSGQMNASGTIFIDFEGKSAEEIKENIIAISRTPKDETLENFPERCMMYPYDYKYDDYSFDWVFYYWHLSTLGISEGIDNVNLHILRNDDGTLDQGSRAGLILLAKDRDRWEELYTICCEALKEILGRDSLMQFGSGDNESQLYMTYHVSKLIDMNGYFTIHIEMPLTE